MSYVPHRDQPELAKLGKAAWDILYALGEEFEHRAERDYHDHEACGCQDPHCKVGAGYRPSAAEVLAYATQTGLVHPKDSGEVALLHDDREALFAQRDGAERDLLKAEDTIAAVRVHCEAAIKQARSAAEVGLAERILACTDGGA